MMPRGLLTALQFLTRLPVPALPGYEASDLARAKTYFPAAGLVIGAFLAATQWSLGGSNPWICSLAILLVWIWITGALHLDGLGDVADALGAAHGSPDRFKAVLDDPHAGNFAVVAISVQIAAKLVTLAHIPADWLAGSLVLIPAWARWGTLVWSAVLPPLKPGLGEQIGSSNPWPAIAGWALALGTASILIVPPLLVALILVPLVALYWRWRLGGITGDCHGASVEVTETLLLAATLLVGTP